MEKLVTNITKKISFININFGIAFIICLLLPITPKLIPILIALWVLTFILQKKEGDFIQNILNYKLLLLIILFFTIHIFALLYTENTKSGFFDIESKLSLLVFPTIFPNLSKIYFFRFKTLLLSFILGCLIASIICLSNSLYLVIALNARFQYLTYSDLSLFLHPTYFSLYLTVAIAGIIDFIKQTPLLSTLKKLSLIFIALFFALMIFLLSSKAGIISLFALSIITFVTFVTITLRTITLGVFSLSILIFILLKNDRFQPLKEMITNTISNKKNTENKTESTNERVIIWSISKKLIQNNWLIGVGAGDVKYDLSKEYIKEGFILGEEKKLNAHNQFLETFLSTGVIGFFLLLIIIFSQILSSFKKKEFLFLSFCIIIFINFLFESILNTQVGIVFFTFFFCLFTVNFKKK